MSGTVTVADFGTSNLLSVARALRHCGADVVLAETPEAISAAEYLVLPGVGAFADAMAGLTARGLNAAVLDHIATGRPFLGICVGMQMMLEASEEFGRHAGLGVLAGEVRAIPPTGETGRRHKIPHIGWNALRPLNGNGADGWAGTLLDGIEAGASVYFVHSFTAWPEDEGARLADVSYHGQRIAAVVRVGNTYGCQFHPEKSGPVGLRILENFLALS